VPYFDFLWTNEIIAHLAEHQISQDDFESVVCRPEKQGTSKSSGRPVAWGHTADGRYIIAVYEFVNDLTVLPVTAYQIQSEN